MSVRYLISVSVGVNHDQKVACETSKEGINKRILVSVCDVR